MKFVWILMCECVSVCVYGGIAANEKKNMNRPVQTGFCVLCVRAHTNFEFLPLLCISVVINSQTARNLASILHDYNAYSNSSRVLRRIWGENYAKGNKPQKAQIYAVFNFFEAEKSEKTHCGRKENKNPATHIDFFLLLSSDRNKRSQR